MHSRLFTYNILRTSKLARFLLITWPLGEGRGKGGTAFASLFAILTKASTYYETFSLLIWILELLMALFYYLDIHIQIFFFFLSQDLCLISNSFMNKKCIFLIFRSGTGISQLWSLFKQLQTNRWWDNHIWGCGDQSST